MAGQRNGYGRRAEWLRPDGRSATARKWVDGRHPTEWRRPPQRVGSSALYRARYWPTDAGPRRPQAFRDRPSVPPPLFCLAAAVGKAVSSRGHCGHIRHCMLGHYIWQGRLKRPPGLTERPVSAADREAPWAGEARLTVMYSQIITQEITNGSRGKRKR
jgi:hypothetical protein